MPVFRVEKNSNYTTMCNYHLRDQGLSLKGKGLLSMLLSLPDTWNYSVRGLSSITPDGVDTMDFKVTPHMLRHTYITNLIYKGVDPKTVQYLAGHENSKTTMDIYAKVKYNKPEELSSVVNAAFGLR